MDRGNIRQNLFNATVLVQVNQKKAKPFQDI